MICQELVHGAGDSSQLDLEAQHMLKSIDDENFSVIRDEEASLAPELLDDLTLEVMYDVVDVNAVAKKVKDDEQERLSRTSFL